MIRSLEDPPLFHIDRYKCTKKCKKKKCIAGISESHVHIWFEL